MKKYILIVLLLIIIVGVGVGVYEFYQNNLPFWSSNQSALVQGSTVYAPPPSGSLNTVVNNSISGSAIAKGTGGLVKIYIDSTNGSQPVQMIAIGINMSSNFSFPIPPQYQDGKQHTVYAYVTANNGPYSTQNIPLAGSPKTFLVKAPATTLPSKPTTSTTKPADPNNPIIGYMHHHNDGKDGPDSTDNCSSQPTPIYAKGSTKLGGNFQVFDSSSAFVSGQHCNMSSIEIIVPGYTIIPIDAGAWSDAGRFNGLEGSLYSKVGTYNLGDSGWNDKAYGVIVQDVKKIYLSYSLPNTCSLVKTAKDSVNQPNFNLTNSTVTLSYDVLGKQIISGVPITYSFVCGTKNANPVVSKNNPFLGAPCAYTSGSYLTGLTATIPDGRSTGYDSLIFTKVIAADDSDIGGFGGFNNKVMTVAMNNGYMASGDLTGADMTKAAVDFVRADVNKDNKLTKEELNNFLKNTLGFNGGDVLVIDTGIDFGNLMPNGFWTITDVNNTFAPYVNNLCKHLWDTYKNKTPLQGKL